MDCDFYAEPVARTKRVEKNALDRDAFETTYVREGAGSRPGPSIRAMSTSVETGDGQRREDRILNAATRAVLEFRHAAPQYLVIRLLGSIPGSRRRSGYFTKFASARDNGGGSTRRRSWPR